jgi:multidrug efflux pump subunit AcrB
MNVTKYSIENNRVTIVIMLMIILGGLMAYFSLPQAEDPGFTIRTAVVTTFFPGASPERIEQLVTDKIEKVVQEIPELESVTSTSRNGLSMVSVNIREEYKDMRPIFDNLRRKIERVAPSLPSGIIGPEVNDEFGDVFGQVLTLTGEGYTYAELKEIADDVRDEILNIDNVAKVEFYGAQDEKIYIEFNNSRLMEVGISPTTLAGMLQSTNIINPGGSISTGFEEIVLEPSGNFETVEELKKTIINIPNSKDFILLEDLAKVYRGYEDPSDARMRYMGTPCLGLAISMKEGGNIVDLGVKLKKKMNYLLSQYPIGIEFNFIAFQPERVEQSVNDFIGNLIQAIIIVLGVMLLTLGLRTGLIVASLIPSAILMTFIFMQMMGIGIDRVSLASLIIALGMLVDNAIVMSEAIMVKMEKGTKGFDAAVEAAHELKIPLLTSSLTTCAAFLPFYLMKSSMGEFVGTIFVVVTITLLSSWVLSLTLIPMLCMYFIKVTPQENNFDSKFYKGYRRFITSLIKHKYVTIIVVFVVFWVSLQGLGLVPKKFMPDDESPIIVAKLSLPVGSPLTRTEEIVNKLEDFIAENLMSESGKDGVENWGTYIGNGGPRFNLTYIGNDHSPESAVILLNTTTSEVVDKLIPEIEEFCFNNFPDAVANIGKLSTGPSSEYPVEVRISGKDTDEVFDIVNDVKNEMMEIDGVKFVTDDWGMRTKKLLVKVDQAKAKRAGISSHDVAASLQASLSGITSTEYREDDKVIPVVIRSVESQRNDINRIESLSIFSSASGQIIPLKQVANVELAWQPAKILRRNRLKSVTIKCSIDESKISAFEVTEKINSWLIKESESWPIGYKFGLGGENENSSKATSAIADQLPIAGFAIIFLLVMQFNSFRRPLIILITIPLGIIGITFGLLVAKSYFGFFAILGLISLAGIVINNAIVLLDTIKLEIEEHGRKPFDAVIFAAQSRLRPIILTTMTTIGGLIPLWFGGGIMWKPMAISIIFGIIFATVLTLGVVPTLYSLFFKVKITD